MKRTKGSCKFSMFQSTVSIAFISITVQLLVPLPPVLFGEAFLHISQTTLWKDEIEKKTLRRYMTNNHGLKHIKTI